MKKIVVKVTILCHKCRTTILRTVAKLSGVKSMELDDEKSTLTVIGDVDPVSIVTALRKKKKQAVLDSVGPEEEEEVKKEEENEKEKSPCKNQPECCRYCRSVPYGTIVWYEEPSWCAIV